MNTHTLSLIGLVLSVFFAGAYLRGEISQQREFKAQMRTIESEHQRTMALVDSINANYARQKLEYLETNKKLYSQLDTLLDLKLANSQKLQRARDLVGNERILLDNDIQDLKDLNASNGL